MEPCSGEEKGPKSVFVYGDSRPDLGASSTSLPSDALSKRAWLLGGRLYAFQKGGTKQAAVRLEEPGHAVLGYVVSTNGPNNFQNLLTTFESREFSPNMYEKDVVEVVTEAGERLKSYVYHCPDVDRSNPVPKGDWQSHQ